MELLRTLKEQQVIAYGYNHTFAGGAGAPHLGTVTIQPQPYKAMSVEVLCQDGKYTQIVSFNNRTSLDCNATKTSCAYSSNSNIRVTLELPHTP